ncbi:MAG: hypothetical protein R2849_18910 [Thermomicrobiales bacterium]
MRVLFTTHATSGHFHPLVPLAKALEAAEHEVAFVTSEFFRQSVEASGFECLPGGYDLDTHWSEATFETLFPEYAAIPQGSRRCAGWRRTSLPVSCWSRWFRIYRITSRSASRICSSESRPTRRASSARSWLYPCNSGMAALLST